MSTLSSIVQYLNWPLTGLASSLTKKQNTNILTNYIISMEDEHTTYAMFATQEGPIRRKLRTLICIRGPTHAQSSGPHTIQPPLPKHYRPQISPPICGPRHTRTRTIHHLTNIQHRQGPHGPQSGQDHVGHHNTPQRRHPRSIRGGNQTDRERTSLDDIHTCTGRHRECPNAAPSDAHPWARGKYQRRCRCECSPKTKAPPFDEGTRPL